MNDLLDPRPVPSSLNPPAVLILGAAGRFGAAAVQAFARAGWRVLAQVHRSCPEVPEGVTVLRLPLSDTAALATAARGCRAVVYAANPLYTRWVADAVPMAGLAMDVAEALGATFLMPGNVYNFGADMPPLLQVDTPQRAKTRKGQVRIALEKELCRRSTAGTLRSVVIRAGDFFGAGTGTWLDLMLAKHLARGRLAYPGQADRVHAWAYLPDLVNAFVAVAAREPAAPMSFTCLHFEGHALTGAQMLDGLSHAASALGVAPAAGFKRDRIPWAIIRLGGLVMPMWREISEMAYLWDVPHALDGAALQAAVGPLPVTPLDDALIASLQLMGHGGLVHQPLAMAQ